ncbi:hypothetical protein DEU56DRAFT_253078 [Suillus clintonianus]|uniref:uncharacterized protein n=1 Tax=Suillus clintonianus TaxID=1904413 RepID=UPI001B87BF64|nr:uncharacterized protein DEU56DRAFT_253078 [Suillus clintonianus]KAG2143004.1 hypothetical protein DEU56DRAFT_253078 [Suillus clintonianus]
MSDKAARSHTHTSNRAKARATTERKDVFKSVLENPFRIQWPSIPSNAQNLFLATLITTLESTTKSRSRKSSKPYTRKALPGPEIADSVEGTNPSPDSMMCSKTSACAAGSTPSPSPVVSHFAPSSSHTTIGINEVTRRLESQLKSVRHSVTLTTASHANPISPDISSIAAVFVCRADVNPSILLDHIPHLVAGYNSARPVSNPLGPRKPLKLIVLPKGSESALAQALGLRRAAVIAVHDDAPYLPIFCDMLQSVPIISAPWLVPPVQPNTPKCLIPTHIKQLRTTAPKDMKSAKEQRAKARIAAKKNSAKPRPKKRVIATSRPDT